MYTSSGSYKGVAKLTVNGVVEASELKYFNHDKSITMIAYGSGKIGDSSSEPFRFTDGGSISN